MLSNIPKNAKKILDEMITERIRGASYLAEKCLDFYVTLVKGSLPIEEIERISREVIKLFPSVAPVYNISNTVLKFLRDSKDLGSVLEDLERYKLEIKSAKARIAETFLERIDVGERPVIITHSYSSVVLETVKKLVSSRIVPKVILTESRPDYEGIHLAYELKKLGVNYEIITDAQIGLVVREADIAVVGADCIARNLDVINKAGTFLLALSARYYDVPFYVLAESFKLHPKARRGLDIKLMERELIVKGLHVRNILFDVTPNRLVTAILTENSIMKPILRHSWKILAHRRCFCGRNRVSQT